MTHLALSGGLQHHAMQAQQQPVMQPQAGVAPTPPVQAQTQQSKEFNTASLCRIGQETVQDIVSRTQEVFQTLKAIQVWYLSRRLHGSAVLKIEVLGLWGDL